MGREFLTTPIRTEEIAKQSSGGGVAYEKVDVQVSDDQNAAKSLPVETPTSNHDSIPPEGGAQVSISRSPHCRRLSFLGSLSAVRD